jgi:hypothetical protein
LDRYGPVYLSASEFTNRRKEIMNKYLRLIGWRALHETDEAFWRFHRKALEEFGYKRVSLTIVTAAIVAVSKVVWEAVHKVGQAVKALATALARLIAHAVRSLSRTQRHVRQQTNNRS